MEVKGTSTSVDSQNVNMVVTETRAMDTGNGPGIAFKGPINTNATPGESTFAVIRAGKLNNTADNTLQLCSSLLQTTVQTQLRQ